MRILANTNFNFIRWRWHAIVLSIAVIATGAVTMVGRGGLALGVDFTGGTVVVLQFSQPTGEEVVRAALQSFGDVSVQKFGAAGQNQILVRLPLQAGSELGTSLDADATRVQEALKAANVGEFTPIKRDLVGPTIGRDLRRKGIMATAASLVGIMAYIAFRFRLSFGVGAMVASLHDVLVTLSLLVLFKYELTLNVVAAILTLTGYGVNDQIVVFDRVRENLRKSRQEPMDSVINKSVNQTLPRTIITAGVTFLAVFALFLFGGDVLEGFAFAMLVGIVTSTYSTVYIASAVAVVLSGRRRGRADQTVTQAQAKARRRA
ncbi:MAG TPA: protein translocase subunit SecF [Vicinamibacterales bacterium]|jgi:preprotein translocase subunit SecF